MASDRITCTPPVIDVDGSLWSVFVIGQGLAVSVAIQVCDGVDHGPDYNSHDYDGEWHDGDTHLFLDRAAASRLLGQLGQALDDSDYVAAKARADGLPFLK